mgnify:CR=1 FL=1
MQELDTVVGKQGASIKTLGAEALFVIEGEQNAGGICGYAVDTEFSECVNYAVIKSSATAGGIAGFAKDCSFAAKADYFSHNQIGLFSAYLRGFIFRFSTHTVYLF